MKRLVAVLLCVALLPIHMHVSKVGADDSDIFGASIQPNVLFLIDNSASMAWGIPTFAYNEPTNPTYPIPPLYPPSHMCVDLKAECLSGTVYKGMGIHPSGGYPRYQIYADDIASVSSAEAQTALATTGYWVGKIKGSQVNLYSGNYLNFLYCTTCAGSKARIDVAKEVLTNLVSNVDGVRFGVMDFNQSPPGAHMVSPIGAGKATMISAINGMSTGGGTPLGGQMRDAASYYKGNFEGRPSPIQYECQPNIVILLTDGLQTDTASGNAVQVQAGVAYQQDHATGLPGTQNVITHTVGFAMEGGEDELTQAVANLKETAQNGGGEFEMASNAAELERVLLERVQKILEGVFAFATPVIPTTSATGLNRAYLAAVQSDPSRAFWRGYVKAYNRDASGQVPTDATTGVPLDSALAWEAGQKLSEKASADRTLYTIIGGTRQSFAKSNSNLTAALLGVSTSTERDNVIDFIRGVDITDDDGDGDRTEDRAWKLGDIFHSTPVVVTPPFLPSPDASYATFRQANSGRTTVVITGSNDGMLHAFQEADGVELWGFAPPDLLGKLKHLSSGSTIHTYFVDSSPVAADVKIGGVWKTVVIFGERRGGRSYHALDVTDTTNPSYLWGFTDTKMGETWSEPVIGKVKMADGTDKYVAFFGGGYGTAQNNNTGKAFFAVDIATGQKLWEYYKSTTTDDRQYMHYSLAANPLALDLNNNGYIDRVYIGDINGQVWRFDISEATTLSGDVVNNWTGKLFFAAVAPTTTAPSSGEFYPAQAIYSAINAAWGDNAHSQLWLYFGTGDRNHPNATASNRFYGVQDNTTMTNGTFLTESSIVDVTSTSTAATQGWYIRLAASEKVLASADIFNKVVFFTTFTPTGVTSCGSSGGDARLYAIQMLSGYAAIDWSTDTVYTTSTSSNTRGKVIGTGIPSKPIVIITDAGATLTTTVIAATTNQQLPSNPAPPPDTMRRILYWREVF